jgi:hypothetical protein
VVAWSTAPTQGDEFFTGLLERTLRLPGISAVTFASPQPLEEEPRALLFRSCPVSPTLASCAPTPDSSEVTTSPWARHSHRTRYGVWRIRGPCRPSGCHREPSPPALYGTIRIPRGSASACRSGETQLSWVLPGMSVPPASMAIRPDCLRASPPKWIQPHDRYPEEPGQRSHCSGRCGPAMIKVLHPSLPLHQVRDNAVPRMRHHCTTGVPGDGRHSVFGASVAAGCHCDLRWVLLRNERESR